METLETTPPGTSLVHPAEPVIAPSTALSMRRAYERVAGDLAAIPDDDLMRVYADVPSAVATVLEHLPELHASRDAWLLSAPRVDVANLDRLEDYALALAHTHAALAVVGGAATELPALYDAALRHRDALLATAKSLAAFGLLDAKRFERVGLDRGYRNIAYDLSSLVELYRSTWSRVGGRCPFGTDLLDAAEECANAILRGSAERDRTPGPTAPSSKERQRAFTALARAYDEVRRVITFLRWHEGDAGDLAPGLNPGRPAGSRKAPPAGEPNTVGTTAAATTKPGSARTSPAATPAAAHDAEPEDTRGKESLFGLGEEI